MHNRTFSERLNEELDNIGAPEERTERIAALSKLIRVPKFKAEALLSGITSADDAVVKILADELEVNADWLLGKTASKSDAH